MLAHAALVAEITGIAPLLLLDEVVAHLDPGRRSALFAELAKLGAQVWLTGADPAAFAEIGAQARSSTSKAAASRGAPEHRLPTNDRGPMSVKRNKVLRPESGLESLFSRALQIGLLRP